MNQISTIFQVCVLINQGIKNLLTRDVGNVHQFLSPELGDLNLLGLIHGSLFSRVSLL